MIRRPPRSTLFPTRRSSDLNAGLRHDRSRPRHEQLDGRSLPIPGRSEEHTSELQSHHDLVCRLLLEKKKSIVAADDQLDEAIVGVELTSKYFKAALRYVRAP